MKKTVITICFLMMLILTSCSYVTKDAATELITKEWTAKTSDTADITLTFDETNGTANMSINSKDLHKEIKGTYLADENSFVIFMPEICRNYYFEYKPKGDTVEITYNKMTVSLKAK